jgi:hypothetical protein
MSRFVVPLVGLAASTIFNAHSVQAKNHQPPIKDPANMVQKVTLQKKLTAPTFSEALNQSAKATESVLIGKTFVPPVDPKPEPTTILAKLGPTQDPRTCGDPRTPYPSNPPCFKGEPNLLLAYKQAQTGRFKLV